MKKIVIRISLILIVVIASFNSVSAQAFEGYIQYKLSGDENSQLLDYYIKGETIRFEIDAEGQKMASIIDKENMIMLMPAQKMYMEFSLKSLEEKAKMFADDEDDEEDVDFDEANFTKGGTETILGYECQKLSSKDEGRTFEMWIAKDLGDFKFMQGPMGGGNNWLSKLSDSGMFPLKMIAKNEDGTTQFKMEALKLEKKSLSNDLFKAPSNFRKMDMGGMFGN
ncbi:MAG: DUF4412 domain-containing protein [Melioribacteraceae bacterium]|nr:DUF4412 domain-containing protein [Melioribacteraceae bacterium]